MQKILGVQFRISQNSVKQEQACILREIGSGVEVDFIDALDKNIDWNFPEIMLSGYSGVVLGGSGELDFDGKREIDDEMRQTSYEILGRLRPTFQYIFDYDIPTLGICYGHQILGAFAGAQVCCDDTQKKSCSHQVKLLVNKADHFLLTDLPESFMAHYGHKDVLDRVPEGAVLLIEGGDKCKVSALQYKKNIYTVQFHPELCFSDMMERIKNSPGYLPEGVMAEEVFKDETHSNKILNNFGKFISLRITA